MAYFLVNGDTGTGLPPLALASAGTVVGAVILGVLGLARVLPMRASTRPAVYDSHHVAWWLPLVVLGLVTAALAYATGIAAGRRLGARLGSSVALLEVLAGVLFAWLLLGELLDRTKVAGGLLVLAGVVAIRLGEPRDVVKTFVDHGGETPNGRGSRGAPAAWGCDRGGFSACGREKSP